MSFITALNLSSQSFLPWHTSRSLVKTCTETRHCLKQTTQKQRHTSPRHFCCYPTTHPAFSTDILAPNILDICTHTATGIQWCTQFLNALFLFQKAIASFIQTLATTQIESQVNLAQPPHCTACINRIKHRSRSIIQIYPKPIPFLKTGSEKSSAIINRTWLLFLLLQRCDIALS